MYWCCEGKISTTKIPGDTSEFCKGPQMSKNKLTTKQSPQIKNSQVSLKTPKNTFIFLQYQNSLSLYVIVVGILSLKPLDFKKIVWH